MFGRCVRCCAAVLQCLLHPQHRRQNVFARACCGAVTGRLGQALRIQSDKGIVVLPLPLFRADFQQRDFTSLYRFVGAPEQTRIAPSAEGGLVQVLIWGEPCGQGRCGWTWSGHRHCYGLFCHSSHSVCFGFCRTGCCADGCIRCIGHVLLQMQYRCQDVFACACCGAVTGRLGQALCIQSNKSFVVLPLPLFRAHFQQRDFVCFQGFFGAPEQARIGPSAQGIVIQMLINCLPRHCITSASHLAKCSGVSAATCMPKSAKRCAMSRLYTGWACSSKAAKPSKVTR